MYLQETLSDAFKQVNDKPQDSYMLQIWSSIYVYSLYCTHQI